MHHKRGGGASWFSLAGVWSIFRLAAAYHPLGVGRKHGPDPLAFNRGKSIIQTEPLPGETGGVASDCLE